MIMIMHEMLQKMSNMSFYNNGKNVQWNEKKTLLKMRK